jgi:urease accessory protein
MNGLGALVDAGSFFGGVLHPLWVPGHVLVLAGLALLAGQQGAPVRLAVSAIFAAGLSAGLTAVVLAFAADDTDLMLLACAAIAGLLVVVARPIPLRLAAPLAAIAGAALELDSVPDEVSMRATVLALAGTALAAALVLLVVASASAICRRDWQRIGIRVLGSWIAASAILVLALRLAR